MSEETLILTQHNYIDVLRMAPAGSRFYYKKDTAGNFNVKKIKNTMSLIGVEINYVGDAGHIGRSVHQISVLHNRIPPEELIPPTIETKFFDPKNLI